MNEQDEKILQLYLNDIRRKKICILGISIVFIVTILFLCFYTKYKPNSNGIENYYQEEIVDKAHNEIVTDKENLVNDENTIVQENTIDKTDEKTKENTSIETKDENIKPDTNDKNNIKTNVTSKKDENTKEKAKNKDFLFTDGYTMENVTQAAQDYLKSSGMSGECIPLKDNEGIYIGMRVIFY